jgi:hypothetical protein
MWLEDHFGSGLQRNERVKLAASFWNKKTCGGGDEEGDCSRIRHVFPEEGQPLYAHPIPAHKAAIITTCGEPGKFRFDVCVCQGFRLLFAVLVNRKFR